LLAREVVHRFGDRARFVVEDFGASPLAERFGVDKYPAFFVDDALVARPEDFVAWEGPAATGKYLPWSELEKRRAFQRDLERMIAIRLAGRELPAAPPGAAATAGLTGRALPDLPMTSLDGTSLRLADLRGKPVLVEFWATWCPPCLHTLAWLETLDPTTLGVVAIAVESKREAVAELAGRYDLPGVMVLGTPELLDAFGGIPAVPTLLLADRDGRIVEAFYGAPPDLHEQVARALAGLR
jgi:thiol-disulfide isomerase/thioredoxin